MHLTEGNQYYWSQSDRGHKHNQKTSLAHIQYLLSFLPGLSLIRIHSHLKIMQNIEITLGL